jgi:hypothetical protein
MKGNMSAKFGFFVGLAVCAQAAMAGDVAIVNPGFEAPLSSSYGQTPSGWSGTGGVWNVVASGYGFDFNTPYGFVGQQVGYLNFGYLSQDLGTGAVSGATYTLSTLYGRRIDGAYGSGELDLYANGVQVATDSFNEALISPGDWASASTTWTATPSYAGEDLSISYWWTGASQIDFDQASLTYTGGSATPGPAALAPFAMGLVALARLRKKA